MVRVEQPRRGRLRGAATARRDTEFGGQRLEAGQKLLLLYSSANRDEHVFDDPFRFDIARDPNEHVAFGFGRHFCLGASLARLELKVLLQETLRRFPDIGLAGEPTRARSLFLNQLKTLPVRFTPEPS